MLRRPAASAAQSAWNVADFIAGDASAAGARKSPKSRHTRIARRDHGARSATGRPRPPDQPLAGLDPRAARPACQPKQQVRESSNICGIDDSAP